MSLEKDIKFLESAIRYAVINSKDPSTQNGAILVRDNKIIGSGANCFPKGVIETPERWERPTKYSYVEHAERNAIYDTIRKNVYVPGSTLYCPWFSCTDCARAIIQSGIKRCVGHDYKWDDQEEAKRWQESVKIGDEMLEEAGVKIDRIDHYFGIKILRGGKLITL